MQDKVLIIDDDRHICTILQDYFEFEGFEVVIAYDGKQGLKKIKSEKPDIIILDLMLPEKDGWEVCQELRPRDDTPIIILSAKNKDTDRITGLELGADDYVTKPFSPKEVVVRARTVLRRTGTEKKDEHLLEFPHLIINKIHRSVEVKEKEIELTPKEFELLWALASSPKRVFTRDKLLKVVWGYEYIGDVRTVDTHIKSLRHKLGEPVNDYIQTVWGVGYKFETN